MTYIGADERPAEAHFARVDVISSQLDFRQLDLRRQASNTLRRDMASQRPSASDRVCARSAAACASSSGPLSGHRFGEA